MKRKLGMALLIAVGILSLSACSGSQETAAIEDGSKASQSLTEYGAPDRPFDLQGQVQTIQGNEITVYAVIGEQLELTEEEKAKKKEEMQNLTPEEKQNLKAESQTISEEAQVFIVPVGIPIIATQSVDAVSQVNELELSDITKGALLKIWFSEDSNQEEAVFIQLANSSGI
jgi:hypothetical protein